MSKIKRIFLIIWISGPVVAAICALIFGNEPIKYGMIDCHSDPEMDCYGVYEAGDETNDYMTVLYKYYKNRYDSIRSNPNHTTDPIFEKEYDKLNDIINGKRGIKIKNHSMVKYTEWTVRVFTLEIDSIKRDVFIPPYIIKPIVND
ncbi:MAG: hypothetical protein OEW75_16475 [Cyclobacteriaceae bacterium]|nr:hypothetical protein [Cyclobacteriaceae bacterium]